MLGDERLDRGAVCFATLAMMMFWFGGEPEIALMVLGDAAQSREHRARPARP